MTNQDIRAGLAQVAQVIERSKKASQAMAAFGKIAMPEMERGDEQLNGVHRSDVAMVFEFFGELICEHTKTAYDLVDQMDISMGQSAGTVSRLGGGGEA